MPFDETQFASTYKQIEKPIDIIHKNAYHKQAKPIPHENKNDFIKKINSKHALYGPIVNIANFAYLKITISNSWEVLEFVPILSFDKHLN